MPNHVSPITLSLAGPRGPADLSDFANAVVALRNALKNVCRCATGNDELGFDVEELQVGSAIVGAAPMPGAGSSGLIVVDLFGQTVKALENLLPIDPRIDYSTLYAFNGFASLARKGDTTLLIGNTKLTARFADRVAQLLEPESTSRGSVAGRLEGVSIHGGTSFTLYPPGGEHVECIVNRGFDDLLQALGKSVRVYGMLHFARTKSFPVRVDIDTFEVMPDESTLPTLLNACGLLQLGATSLDLTREMRDEWK